MPVSTSSNIQQITSGSELTKEYLENINKYLWTLSPTEILSWAIDHLPNLYQTTAFGLTGLATVDMINKISIDRNQNHLVPLIFLDTLYHFEETLELAKRCQETYQVPLHVYKPMDASTTAEFEQEHGSNLWKVDEDMYDYLVKVEPARRAYEELNVKSVITGRRRSQRGDRENIPILEVDGTGLIKLNPLALWDFQQVWTYIRANEVPYNALIDQGYKSIGDHHSTKKPTGQEGERDGRWAGQQKTECGLHKDYFKMRAAFMASKKKRQEQQQQQQQQQQHTSMITA
ncbi:phosphoadenosine phosphosulfate reductase [Halteromyces radiatus]|uniref:phosphoadenosine phosphosulfate reductase n=1 Tax=Halteromyces radiatus TaxID=101107 RepID=UPI00221F657E|nr:phosphoadenosine phosphosulfate reductase [Halteromyces radiatus]KAI8099945.1 phosphoadenosine phosphosulfate reductase [Halteromyces radiatus]